MKKTLLATGFATFAVLAAWGVNAPAAQAATPTELAAHWAPEFYQDTNSSHGYTADYLAKFNYDGDWVGTNNWENLYNYPQAAHVYYSVVETSTHYFIGYYTFHARDDGPTDADKHENDLEGALVVVRKDGSPYGQFQLVETMAHDQWYQYTNDANISNGHDNIDGGVRFNGHRPQLFIQANGQSPWNGHGIKAWDGSGAPGGDGIVYYYNGTAQTPTAGGGNYVNRYSYNLVSIDELWTKRNQIDGATYASWGALAGDTYGDNKAKAPWGWDDGDDGPTFTGDVFADPAHFVDTHLNGLGSFSHTYVYHPYYTHKVTVNSLISKANRDPFGGKSDIFAKIKVDGEAVSDDRMWKKNDATTGTRYNLLWGHDDASSGFHYSANYNFRYVAKKQGAPVAIEVYDSDGTSGDDGMGSLNLTLYVGQVKTWTDAATSNGEALVSATVENVR